ncbi:hypothetical protein A3780_03880 [Kosakonia radicincitans]|uniref:hypothetical protein n=1 Tax=Kosakonia radicincitans TaxID=283686 RepID=UPI00090337EF|nr:hypothetical protein [Kosakonia radicincitans]APG16736.1 hypothetical protein A3780_03880 [Kosakonia radicincitans]
MVKRIGILGITDLTETLLAGLFRLAPDAHVFLLADSFHRAEDLARQFPCWILDNDRAVIDEADMILVSTTTSTAEHSQQSTTYRPSQTVVYVQTESEVNLATLSLLTATPSMVFSAAQIDDLLFLLHAFLPAIKTANSIELSYRMLPSATLRQPGP